MSKVSKIIVAFRDDATTREQEEHLVKIRKAHDASKKNAPTAEGVTFVYRDLMKGYAGSFADEVVALIKDERIVKKYEDDLPMEMYGMPITKTTNWGLWRVFHKSSVVPLLQLHLNPPKLYDYVCQSQYGENVPVYVVDSGLNNISNEFNPLNVTHINAVRDPTALQVEDDTDEHIHAHGTISAAMIAGKTLGVANRCKLIVCKFTQQGTDVYFSNMMHAITMVALHHRDNHGNDTYAVVNCSWGRQLDLGLQGHLFESVVRRAISDYRLIFVAAAGNSGVNAGDVTPARMPDVITVGATDRDDQKGHLSNFGDVVDIYAPGIDVPSVANVDDPYTRHFIPGGSDGTSFAAPLVAGVIACLVAASAAAGIQRAWTPAVVKAELRRLGRESVFQQTPGPVLLLGNGSDMT